MLRIKLIRSKAGSMRQHNATVAALGLRKMHQVVEKEDTSSIRGMIHHVRHMVSVEVVEGSVPQKAPKPAKSAPAPKPAAVSAAPAATADAKPKVEKAAKAASPAKKPAAKKPATAKKDSKE